MRPAQSTFNHVVAFEVSKQTLVVHVLPGDHQYTIANKPKAVRKLLAAQVRHNAQANLGSLLVVCEATGGYERHVLEICVDLGLSCHQAHGKRVRDFANYLGVLAKTDPIDARVIALHGLKTEGLRLYQPPSPQTRALKDLQNRRAEILEMLIAESNRLEHARHPSVAKTLKAHIVSLQKIRAALEAEIATLIRTSEVMARKARLMRGLKGIGPVTVATLLAHMPELGTLVERRGCRPRWPRPAQSRQRQGASGTPHRRWPQRHPPHALHGSGGRHATQRNHESLRSRAGEARQALQGCRHRGDAKTSRHLERHLEIRRAMETCTKCLKLQTVDKCGELSSMRPVAKVRALPSRRLSSWFGINPNARFPGSLPVSVGARSCHVRTGKDPGHLPRKAASNSGDAGGGWRIQSPWPQARSVPPFT